MTGDATRRFCSHCNKYVHNLSAMPADEAERLICSAAGSMCVRFARDPETQRVLTLDYQPQPKVSRRRAIVVLASILGACGVSGTWAATKLLRKPPPPPPVSMLQGDMSLPAPPSVQGNSTAKP